MDATVGIIANPAAAHDVRRLSGYGSIVDNHEKVRILRRVLFGLRAVGVDQVLAMPDPYNLAMTAASTRDLGVSVRMVDMARTHNERDSTLAAERMALARCACIVVLGGDGTNRAVAKGSRDVPLVPISTGTNNVIPRPIEGTIAGMAAGLFARGLLSAADVVRRSKRLEIMQGDEIIESALVDVAASTHLFLGARAVTELAPLRQLWLTQAVPGAIGLSAIGAHLHPLSPAADHALFIELAPSRGTPDPGAVSVLAPIAPGLVREATVLSWRLLNMGVPSTVGARPSVLALDGERTLPLLPGEPPPTVRATWTGPRLLDVESVMNYAATHRLFLRPIPEERASD